MRKYGKRLFALWLAVLILPVQALAVSTEPEPAEMEVIMEEPAIVEDVQKIPVGSSGAEQPQEEYEPEVLYIADDGTEFISGLIPEEHELAYPSYEDAGGPRRTPRRTSDADTNATIEASSASYDQRSTIQTPVKNQAHNGLCWDFSAMAITEANMKTQIVNGVTDAPSQPEGWDTAYTWPDLSELHVGYSISSYDGSAENANIKGYKAGQMPGDGGNRTVATAYMMRGAETDGSGHLDGLVTEPDDPYVVDGSIPVLYGSSAKPDTFRSLAETKTKTPSYQVRNAYFLAGDKSGTDAEKDAIKKAVVNYGAVGASMYWDGSTTASGNDGNTTSYYKNGAYYYTGDETKTNHAVTIVGWDDNYSASNFAIDPGADGAWLVKNSWGTNWGVREGTDNKATGYFWISYNDKIFPATTWCVDGVEEYDPDTYVYEYEYMGFAGPYYYQDKDYTAAQVFTNTGTTAQAVSEIRMFIASAESDVEVDVLGDAVAASGSYDKTTFAPRGSVHCTYPGWYTVKLDTPAIVNPGSSFTVVANGKTDTSYKGSSSSGYLIFGTNSKTDPTGNVAPTADVSFLLDNGKWDNLGYGSLTTNYCIKAVAVPATDADSVAAAAYELSWDNIKSDNPAQDQVYTALNLITSGSYDTTIAWTSSNTNAIAADGAVTRLDTDTQVTLTAAVTKGSATAEKAFTVTVPAKVDDPLAYAEEHLWDTIKGDNTDQDNITSNLNLLTSLVNDVTAVWTSDNTGTGITGGIDADGTVTRPRLDQADLTVTLTATLTSGGTSKEVSLTLTVLKKTKEVSTGDERIAAEVELYNTVEKRWAAIGNGNTDSAHVRTDLTVPAPKYADKITLEPNDGINPYVSSTGAITRPAYGKSDVQTNVTQEDDKTVELYMWFWAGGASGRSVNITVLAYKAKLESASLPETLTVGTDSDAELTVETTMAAETDEPGTLTCEWYQTTDADTNSGGTLLDTTSENTYTIDKSKLTDGETYYYYCVVSAQDAAETVTSNVMTLTVTDEIQPDDSAQIYGSSLTLEGDIGVNFYIAIPDSIASGATVTVQQNPGDENVKENTWTVSTDMQVKNADNTTLTTDNGIPVYKFSYPVAAKEMNDILLVSLKDAEEKTIPLRISDSSTAETYSYYAVQYINDTRAGDTYTGTLKDLLDSLYDYGCYAQKYFVYKADDLTVEDITPEDGEKTALEEYTLTPSGSVTGVTYAGSSLLLESTTTLRHYFKVDNPDGLTWTVNDTELTPVEITGNTAANYYVDIRNIAAQDLDESYTLTVTDGSDTFTLTAAALWYANSVLNSTEDQETSLTNLTTALYRYNVAANGYFDKQS